MRCERVDIHININKITVKTNKISTNRHPINLHKKHYKNPHFSSKEDSPIVYYTIQVLQLNREIRIRT